MPWPAPIWATTGPWSSPDGCKCSDPGRTSTTTWPRQFSDEQLHHVVRRHGVIGVALDAIMLQPGWVRGTTTPVVTLESVADNIDHVCQLAGNARQVGIGSDLDGGYGSEQTPADLDTIADLGKLPALLQKRGYP